LNAYCNERFLASTVHTGERIRFGFYGVSLKGQENVGKKSKKGNRKLVEMIDGANNVVKTFESITHAANEIGVTISAISLAISSKKSRNGFFFRVKEVVS
jgi:hypothetical protein